MESLVDEDLRELVGQGRIGPDLEHHVQPASIDIPLGSTAYLVTQKFLPFSSDVASLAKSLAIEVLDLSKGAVFLRGQTYLVKCIDLDLPSDLHVRVSPKSSIGRIDVLVRAVADRNGLYDRVLEGYRGELWLEVTPNSYNIRVEQGIALSQLRVVRGRGSIEQRTFLFNERKEPVKHEWFSAGKALLHLSVSGHVGYEGVFTNEVLDLSHRDADPKVFFRRIDTDHKITLEKDRFYILTTKEYISIPPDLSGEMVPFFHLVGELRVHYAGFFDPGFGYPDPNIGVLEVRPQETLTVYDGQPICLMELYPHARKVAIPYGAAGKNYAVQHGPTLAKFFAPWT
jgi:dCTP deaminase